MLILLSRYDRWHVLVTFVIICQKLWTSLNHLCPQILSPSGLAGSTQEIFGGVLCRSPGGTALGHPIWKHLDVDGNGMWGMDTQSNKMDTMDKMEVVFAKTKSMLERCSCPRMDYIILYLKIATFTRKLRISQQIWYIADTPFWLASCCCWHFLCGCFSAWGNGLCNARAGYNCDPLPWSQQQLVWVHQGSITVVVTLLNWGQLALALKIAFAAWIAWLWLLGPLGHFICFKKKRSQGPKVMNCFSSWKGILAAVRNGISFRNLRSSGTRNSAEILRCKEWFPCFPNFLGW